jgi:hypothetical protein
MVLTRAQRKGQRTDASITRKPSAHFDRWYALIGGVGFADFVLWP